MIVRLTAPQFERMFAVIEGHPVLCSMFRWDESATTQDVEAPYLAWLMTRDLMLQKIYKRSGARSKEVPVSLGRAFQRIVHRINWMDRHPALREVAMKGRIAEEFPVWPQPADGLGRVWCPMPTAHGEMVVLVPQWDFDRDITFWAPGEPREHWLNKSEPHLALLGQAAVK